MNDFSPDAGPIRFPDPRPNPLRMVVARLIGAVLLVVVIAGVVVIGEEGYRDVVDGDVSALDALYYATVSVTTTGYGDIVPVTPGARLVNVVLITPMRVAFLILVVSTTVEVLASSTRYLFRIRRWRRTMEDHYVICGYGTKGRSAASTLISQGTPIDRIVVVEVDPRAADEATAAGHAVVLGDCTREEVLRRARVEEANGVIIAVSRDDAAVLATLTVRVLNQRVRVVASVREEENLKLLRRSGASLVITSDEATGRLLGMAIERPHHAALIEDLLLIGEGVDLGERPVDEDLVGKQAPDGTIGVIRGGRILAPDVTLLGSDRLLYLERDATAPES
ncbi:MAG TPA: potassium channel family protein [Acidimicrobiia bacterium]|nr:potassium channel family protein [Acidimicrobiia bacterium]